MSCILNNLYCLQCSSMVYTNLKKPKRRNAINIGLVEVMVLIINLESYRIVHCSSFVHKARPSCCTNSLAPIFGQTEKKNLIKLGGAYVQQSGFWSQIVTLVCLNQIVVYNHTQLIAFFSFFSIARSNFYFTISEQQQIKFIWPNKGVLWKLFTIVADCPPLSLSSLYTEMSLSPSTDTRAPSLCQMQYNNVTCSDPHTHSQTLILYDVVQAHCYACILDSISQQSMEHSMKQKLIIGRFGSRAFVS